MKCLPGAFVATALLAFGCTEPEAELEVLRSPTAAEMQEYHESERYQQMMSLHCQMNGENGREYELWMHVEDIDQEGPLYCLSSFGDAMECFRKEQSVDGETYVGERNEDGEPMSYLRVTSTGEAVHYDSYRSRHIVDGELVDLGLRESISTGTCANGRAH